MRTGKLMDNWIESALYLFTRESAEYKGVGELYVTLYALETITRGYNINWRWKNIGFVLAYGRADV